MKKINRVIDLTGQQFGRLTAIKRVGNGKHGESRWLFKCSCGNMHIAYGRSVRSGNTQSCGCLNRERLLKRLTKHGLSKTRIYSIFQGMYQRCYDKNNKHFKDYGARGINICDEWLSGFKNFYDWAMNNGYTDQLSIDRIDNNKGYSPNNCRWVTSATQVRNTRRNIIVNIDGERKTVAEWAAKLGVSPYTIYSKIKRKGIDPAKVIGSYSARFDSMQIKYGRLKLI